MLQYSNIDGAATPSVQAIALPPGRKVRFAVSVLTFHDLDGPQKQRVPAWMLGQLAGPALAAPQLPFNCPYTRRSTVPPPTRGVSCTPNQHVLVVHVLRPALNAPPPPLVIEDGVLFLYDRLQLTSPLLFGV